MNEAQRDGRACIRCGSETGRMVPAGRLADVRVWKCEKPCGEFKVVPVYGAFAFIAPSGAAVTFYSIRDREQAEQECNRLNARSDER